MTAPRNLQHLPGPQARASRLLRPFRAHLVVTHKCNLACAHCYQAEHDSDDLSTEELFGVLAQLAELGAFQVVLGGGEPMARRDFWMLVEEARRRRFVVQIFTNATLIDEAKAKRLKELGVASVSVSLHGAEAATHDRFVRRKGAFDRINRALDLLEAQQIPVMIKTNATRTNVGELPQLERRFEGRRLRVLSVEHRMFARDDGDTSPLHFRMTEEEERRTVRRQLEAMSREEFAKALDRARMLQDGDPAAQAPCEAARTGLAVHPNGDVTPCTQSSAHVMGNVRQRPLAEIWEQSTVGDRFRSLSHASFVEPGSECATCEFRKVCSRCPAMSFNETGRLTGYSAQLCQQTKVKWSEVRRRAAELGLDCPV